MPRLPTIHVVRRGQTLWSLSGQHTGRTDIPLTERGEANARTLAPRLAERSYAKVLTSPLQRAARTCELVGFIGAEADPDLLEWDYGGVGALGYEHTRDRPAIHLWNDTSHLGASTWTSPQRSGSAR
jgi:broad specificity phosphatase PhoE